MKDVSLEENLWNAACLLRGKVEPSDYKMIVLALIFLKYISDVFEKKYSNLAADGKLIFVPEEARWNVIAEKANDPNIAIIIDTAIGEIEKANNDLVGVLPTVFKKTELDGRSIGKVVDLFSNINMLEADSDADSLGHIYEYFLSMFAKNEGKMAGEYYTPTSVAETIVELLNPVKGIIYDPCCGSGGMFIHSAKYIERNGGNINDVSFYGQESNPSSWKIEKMNMALHGIDSDIGKGAADTFFNDWHSDLKADYIISNPPFNYASWGADELKDDDRWTYGLPPKNNANLAWLQHMLHHLAKDGKMGIVMANGTLSSRHKGEFTIRKKILEDDLIECIIALPAPLFYNSHIATSIWILNRQKKQKGKTLFIDAQKMGSMNSKKIRELNKEEISIISEKYEKFCEGELADENGLCAVVSSDTINNHNCVLNPGTYINYAASKNEKEPFEEELATLSDELLELFEKGHILEKEIIKKLEIICDGV